MSNRHTGNTGFHSKSPSRGTSRWLVDGVPGVVRAYAVHCPKPYLADSWWLIGLFAAGGAFRLRCYPAGSGQTLSLDVADIETIMASTPTIDEPVPCTEEAEALKRMERAASNVMHGLLDPTHSVVPFWRKIAQEPSV